ncbi:MAG TPA: trigger factor [Candidatus Saccharimonadia bacterium]|nr:trigger factor [Candidatus Saccharimonadia bacterium]
MQTTNKKISPNLLKIKITADAAEILEKKDHMLRDHFASRVKIPGFREGKAPLNLIEKNVDQNVFQAEFLDEIINDLYSKAINQDKIKVVDQPKISIVKFVPFESLEFDADVSILGDVVLPDYKKIKLTKKSKTSVTQKDIDEVIDRIKKQVSEKKDVNRAAKLGDQVWIDFKGEDLDKKPVKGADGNDYPVVLGSKTFIPGFEDNLIGLKAGADKTFKLVFPKDYQLKALASREVTFYVHMIKVQELIEPVVDDALAAKVGPFTTVAELTNDVKKQLEFQKQSDIDKEYESQLLELIVAKTKLTIPESLITQEVDNRLKELKQNLTYRGQTFNEFLEQENTNEEDYLKNVIKPEALKRLKGSIVLSEISELETINLTNEEVDSRIELMKKQYSDPASVEEMAKPEFKREVASRMVAEKTIEKLVGYSLN